MNLTICHLLCIAKKLRFVTRVAALAFCTLGLNSVVSSQQPGTLDTGWGGAGVVNQNVLTTDFSRVVLVQNDGKVLVAGRCKNQFSIRYCVTRYNVNGSQDLTFAASGSPPGVLSDIFDAQQEVNAFITAGQILPNGKIVIAGSCEASQGAVCVARINSDGTKDTTFNSAGINSQSGAGNVTVRPSANLGAEPFLVSARTDTVSMAVQKNGQINLLSQCYAFGSSGGMCLTRINADGTFAAANNTPYYTNSFRAGTLTVLPDDRLLATADCTPFNQPTKSCLFVFAQDGTFERQIEVFAPSGASAFSIYSLAVRNDGKIFVTGNHLTSTGEPRIVVLGFNQDLTVDTSFGLFGVAAAAISGATELRPENNIALHPDGRIVVSTLCKSASATNFSPCAARFSPIGLPDKAFGTPIVSFGSTAPGYFRSGLAVQNDGKVLMTFQNTLASGGSDFSTLRLSGGTGFASCNSDIDGDGNYTATIDGLILTRIMLGMSGSSVLNGINVNQPLATRRDWSAIREFLVGQCGMAIQ
jgi:uncharacterized delta-60 repeat protein